MLDIKYVNAMVDKQEDVTLLKVLNSGITKNKFKDITSIELNSFNEIYGSFYIYTKRYDCDMLPTAKEISTHISILKKMISNTNFIRVSVFPKNNETHPCYTIDIY